MQQQFRSARGGDREFEEGHDRGAERGGSEENRQKSYHKTPGDDLPGVSLFPYTTEVAWPAVHLALLATEPDDEVSQQVGQSPTAV
jgi:hypothetical protein